jgi:O-antigen/teichoic acid export membrane protein
MKFLTKFSKGSLGRNAVWTLAGQGLSVILQAAYFILLARLLGSQQYGIFVGAVALVAILSQYSSLGSGMVLVRYVSQDRTKFSEFWGNAILTTLVVGSLIILALKFLGGLLIGAQSASVLILVAVGECTCAKLTECAGQAFQAFEKMQTTAMLTALTSAVRFVTVCFLILTLHHATAGQWAWASLWVSLISVVVAVTTVSFRLGWPKFGPKLFFKSAAEGFGFSFASSTTSVYNDLDKTMLSRYGFAAANGAYSVAYRLVDFSCVPMRSLHFAALPRFFQKGASGVSECMAFARKILKKTFPFAIFASVMLYLFASLIPFIVGKSFTESVSALRWLCLLPIFRSLHLSAGDTLTGAGFQRYRTASQVVAAGMNFALNLYLIPRFSWRGAAWSSLMTDGLLAAMNWLVLTRLAARQRSSACTIDRTAEAALTPQVELGS